jgi:hypothetical protein
VVSETPTDTVSISSRRFPEYGSLAELKCPFGVKYSEKMNRRSHDASATGVMTGAQPHAVIAMEILIEQIVIALRQVFTMHRLDSCSSTKDGLSYPPKVFEAPLAVFVKENRDSLFYDRPDREYAVRNRLGQCSETCCRSNLSPADPCQPVSVSPSPTIQVTTKSRLPKAAPKACDRA